MDKSVEHILLRLLTPAVLLFFAAHLAAGALDGFSGREQSAGGRSPALFLEGGSDAARMMRPSKVQLRKPRIFEHRMVTKPRFLEVAAAYLAVLLEETEPQERPAYALSQIAVPSLFAHARTRNPRDPPRLLT